MAMRTTLTRMNFMKRAAMQRRGFSGRVLSEEEKAAENIYIKKMEKEKLEKVASQEVKAEEVGKVSESSNPETVSTPPKDISSDFTKNVAVAAGVVMFVAAGWWYQRANKKVPEEDKE